MFDLHTTPGNDVTDRGALVGYLTSKSEQIKTMNPDIKTQTTQLAINTHEPSAYLLNRYIYRLNNSRKDN